VPDPLTVLRAIPEFLPLSQTFIDTGARALRPDIDTVFLADDSTPDARWFPGHRVETLPRPWYGLLPGLRRRRERVEFLLAMKAKYNAQILHVHFGLHAVRWIDAAHYAGLPLIVSMHGYDASAWPRAHPGCYDDLFRSAAHVMASSEDLRRRLIALGCPEGKVSTFVVGIEPDRFAFRERQCGEHINILAIGRFVPKKGFLFLADAVLSLVADGGPLRLTLLGFGPDARAPAFGHPAIRLIDPRGAADPFTLRDRLMAEADLAVVPSCEGRDGDAEGTPNALLELQAAGLPVLATRHAGIPDASAPDGTVLVDPGSADALARGLRELVARSPDWPSMGRACRAWIEDRFDARKNARIMAELYRRLI
jgi:colanic acid/amylovoran biosynthesis glycosyltransferase